MRTDNRLSRMLHVLVHMSNQKGAATSETIAKMLSTNPVVVRRTMAGLREAGYVTSSKGHNGGWELATPLEKITMADIYRALGSPEMFALGLANDDPKCLIEKAVNARIGETLAAAEAMIVEQFGSMTLAEIRDDFEKGMAALAHAERCG
ncbi:RrF2 family transcriptional regulator [Pelagibacterium halotolerans]|uniref:Rrf2 family transcriptional regulator, group III n=1 Tax=Pelagibacterium halotolerans (strain DSM 22347 / JCM 15775 / CGMCC 1.7692 / B2) TaxID=1082931 RepID=G4R8P0_PELHB|nr:Rrf2 family transcriptional regulator [Pelagibacterium halotolerans]AEQ50326.1 Rrf2 family transcriptional regulator, group III [Pelagibacterium halotolerans B2]QJR19688.1 Rrf2 family transcriptional regulator [Pelagibacterium halotolerans]SEA53564.1 transcriptional regulator, BadM/Rrf2 family [Pelagibacterium halotolerans]